MTPRSAAALTETINALLDHPHEQQRLREAGYAFVPALHLGLHYGSAWGNLSTTFK